MAKKRFTDDLFGLFEEPAFEEAAPRAEPPAPAVTEEEEAVEVEVPVRNTSARRKLSSKGFTQDLDAFMSDSFELEAQRQAPPASKSGRRGSPSRRRRAGLDLLIRSTVRDDDEDQRPRGSQTPETKRVTLIFNKQHLVKLKEEAKERKMYLKDVVQEMVAGYLERE